MEEYLETIGIMVKMPGIRNVCYKIAKYLLKQL